MILRPLEPKDAPFMLEWMHDGAVVAHLSANFAAKTLADCKKFIAWSCQTQEDVHLAVADEKDEYMGTVSLKHIDRQQATAEFAITFRACAQGKGYAGFGMDSILRYGLEKLELKEIYWCVSPENGRAVHFYDKNGYLRTRQVPAHILEHYSPELSLQWYVYRG